MDSELEMIRSEMDVTRDSLAHKIGELESQVRDTVTGATEAPCAARVNRSTRCSRRSKTPWKSGPLPIGQFIGTVCTLSSFSISLIRSKASRPG